MSFPEHKICRSVVESLDQEGFPSSWAAALLPGWGALKAFQTCQCFHCLNVFVSLGQKYFPYKQRFEAPVRILVSSSQMRFSCTMPLMSIVLVLLKVTLSYSKCRIESLFRVPQI